MVPLPGADPDVGWSGLIPFEEMPHATGPTTGFYVTANNPPLPEGEGPFLGYDWVNGYRAAAITEALERREELSVLGLAHAAGFSWERAARETLGVYQEALA